MGRGEYQRPDQSFRQLETGLKMMPERANQFYAIPVTWSQTEWNYSIDAQETTEGTEMERSNETSSRYSNSSPERDVRQCLSRRTKLRFSVSSVVSCSILNRLRLRHKSAKRI